MLLIPANHPVNKHLLEMRGTVISRGFYESLSVMPLHTGLRRPNHLEPTLCLLVHILSTQGLRISYPSGPIQFSGPT